MKKLLFAAIMLTGFGLNAQDKKKKDCDICIGTIITDGHGVIIDTSNSKGQKITIDNIIMSGENDDLLILVSPGGFDTTKNK